MKEFNSLDDVELMSPCVKRPLQMYAKQVDEAFTVINADRSISNGKPGDYIMKVSGGELHIYNKEIFENLFRFE